MSSRFRHHAWRTEGESIEGAWVFSRETKSGRLGEVEHADGTRTGFTCPTMLSQQLDAVEWGTYIRITFLKATPTATPGRRLYHFLVWQRP
jgi:hypothetical protein